MKAVVVERYGPPDVVRIMEVPTPTPKAGEILVKVHASPVNTTDARTRALEVSGAARFVMGLTLGFGKPRQPILGTVFAGTVTALGEGVTQFQVGDAVFGSSPGMRSGCHAEFVAIPADGPVALKPESLSFQEAAALPFGGNVSLYFLNKHAAKAGERILINGASGAVGSIAVQVARNMGLHVTGVASGINEMLVRELGAEHFINYTTDRIFTPNTRYHLVLDTVGKMLPSQAKSALMSTGRYINICSEDVSKENRQQLEQLARWADEGKLKAVIHSILPMEKAQEAHQIVDSGHKRGSLILSMHAEKSIQK